MPNTTLHNALLSFAPYVAERYEASTKSLFARMVEEHGPSLKGVFNSWRFARAYGNHVSKYVRIDGFGNKELNTERLTVAANAYAEATIATWENKILIKVGELTETTVVKLDFCAFGITGKRGGRAVQITQQMIVNVSSQGKAFNQFPARIYVDDKLVSEKAYQQMFKEAAL